jgi:xylan 1,4-beta-xylosidase
MPWLRPVSLTPRHFSHSAGLVVFYDEKNFAYLRLYSSESLRSTALGIVLLRAGTKQELLAHRAVRTQTRSSSEPA